ncbi:hypothetical protein CCACVL1_27453, partial [Corchorus capsularis]
MKLKKNRGINTINGAIGHEITTLE